MSNEAISETPIREMGEQIGLVVGKVKDRLSKASDNFSEQINSHIRVRRVKDRVGAFVKSRLPSEVTNRSMKMYDRLTGKLGGKKGILARNLREPFHQYARVAGVVSFGADLMLLTTVGVGGSLFLYNKFFRRRHPAVALTQPIAAPVALTQPVNIQESKPIAKEVAKKIEVMAPVPKEPSIFSMERADLTKIPSAAFGRISEIIHGMSEGDTKKWLRQAIAGGDVLYEEFLRSGVTKDDVATIRGKPINVSFARWLAAQSPPKDKTMSEQVMKILYSSTNRPERLQDGWASEVRRVMDAFGIDLSKIYHIHGEKDPYMRFLDFIFEFTDDYQADDQRAKAEGIMDPRKMNLGWMTAEIAQHIDDILKDAVGEEPILQLFKTIDKYMPDVPDVGNTLFSNWLLKHDAQDKSFGQFLIELRDMLEKHNRSTAVSGAA